jgi:uncharacterized protein (DUF1800 family)
MELHTLGVDGGYSQKDVQEVARCLTGWSVNRQTGTFVFNRRGHDTGEKIVLGQPIPAGGGIEDGERVLDILAAHPSTSRFISRKLCQRLVRDEPPTSLVDKCVRRWNETDGDLREVVRTIVTSPEFFSRAAYKQKIKSPFEFAVSSVRALGGTIEPAAAVRQSQRRGRFVAMMSGRGAQSNNGTAGEMPAGLAAIGAVQGIYRQMLLGQIDTLGQPLFAYQAPTGYPEDSRKWVSSGALIARLNFALRLADGRVPDVRFDLPLARNVTEPGKALGHLAKQLLGGSDEMSPATRATLLKQAGNVPTDADSAAADTTTAVRLTALVLGSPEFQRR